MSRNSSRLALRALRTCLTSALGVVGLCGLSSTTGCLDRPLAPSSPKTSNAVTDEVKISKVDKIDLLFMIDNSASMGDKQDILSFAVPDLVNRLVDPTCFNDVGEKGTKTNGQCAAGFAPEFDPILDIHIGVVTSSLGGHGSDNCELSNPPAPANSNDKGELLTRGKDSMSVPTNFYKDSGFFAWDAATPPAYPGENTFHDAGELKKQFQFAVQGAGESGCGFEASLEAWYRFLVDPVPPSEVPMVADTSPFSSAAPKGVNDKILSSRDNFLRPDSLVAVIVLSDENDCSVTDGPIPENNGFPDQLYLREQGNGAPFLLRPGTKACAENPYDPDCKSCFNFNKEDDPDAIAGECLDDQGHFKYLTRGGGPEKGQDPLNLRCWNQKQRYGLDAMYPLSRYVNGLTEPLIAGRVVDANGDTLLNNSKPSSEQTNYFNPLLVKDWKEANDAVRTLKAKGLAGAEFDTEFKKLQDKYLTTSGQRDGNLVFFATIVGVPWQDIARNPADLTAGFRPVKDFGTKLSDVPKDSGPIAGKDFSTWDLILGDVFGTELEDDGTTHKAPTSPLDPLMVERRDQINKKMHPITGEVIGGSDTWNSINGQEWNPLTDLQFACILPLPAPVMCGGAVKCSDCGETPAEVTARANPLCNVDKAANSTYDNTRRSAKAYPGTRFLQVLKDFNGKVQGNGIGASICASNVTDDTKDDFGYRPAVAAIIDRLKSQLAGRCFPRALSVTNNGTVDKPLNSAACLIIEASDPKDDDKDKPSEACKCDGKGEAPVPENVAAVLTGKVKDDFFCRCELKQFGAENDELAICQSNPSSNLVNSKNQAMSGWCYVDPEKVNQKDAAAVAAANKIVEKCDENAKHTIRFINTDTAGSTLFITCLGAAAGTE